MTQFLHLASGSVSLLSSTSLSKRADGVARFAEDLSETIQGPF